MLLFSVYYIITYSNAVVNIAALYKDTAKCPRFPCRLLALLCQHRAAVRLLARIMRLAQNAVSVIELTFGQFVHNSFRQGIQHCVVPLDNLTENPTAQPLDNNCAVSPKSLFSISQHASFRQILSLTALKILEIHTVFLRIFALSSSKFASKIHALRDT